jgi:hypothetical protein
VAAKLARTLGAGPPAEPAAEAAFALMTGANQSGSRPALALGPVCAEAGWAEAALAMLLLSSARPLPPGHRGAVACQDGVGAGLR